MEAGPTKQLSMNGKVFTKQIATPGPIESRIGPAYCEVSSG